MKQNWSRRELEAFGEPLGDSVTQRKLGGGYICGGGGKGGGGGGSPPPPATQTVTQTAIPEYARPYVETMLGKTEALTDINQNPYQAYGGQRIAGFNPIQERAFQNVANQQVAGQIGAGTTMAGASGLGSIGTANQLGQLGQQYASQVTNPYVTQSYMSPYMQNVVDVQKNEALRDAQMRNVGANLGAARQGTYGGARQVLAEQERNRNLQQQMANIQATGSQNAFQAAQQAQQYGANLGLQGLQGQLAGYGQAGQMAGTLGQLGQTQFGQQQAITQGLQNVGAVQQAQAQQGLDMAYQDFLKQRNYPYQQLAFMSDMTRGLPLSQAAQQVYTAPPSAASQLGGLGMSALGIYGMSGGFKGASGGLPKDFKSYAKGGLAYATGGDIKMMSTDQLEALLENPGLTPLEVDMVEKQLMVRRRMAMNPESDQIMSPALRSGIASISTGNMVPEEMAGGGIVAFATGNKVQDKFAAYEDMMLEDIKRRQKVLEQGDPYAKAEAEEANIRKSLQKNRETAPYRALAMAGLGTMAGTSQNALSNLGLGGIEGLKSYAQAMREQDEGQKLLLQQAGDREKSKFARETALLGSQQTALGQMLGRRASAEATAAARGETASRNKQLDFTRAQTAYNSLYNNALDNLKDTAKPGGVNYRKYKDDPAAMNRDARAAAMNELSPQLRDTLGFQAPTATGTPPPAAPVKAPPKAAVQQLKNMDTPETRKQFDAIFGPGAAQRALGK